MLKPGQRAGAFLSADEVEMHLLGYGVYDGHHVPEDGWLHDAGIANPRITLDDGRVVWGYQCWWGGEEEVKELARGRKLVDAAVDD